MSGADDPLAGLPRPEGDPGVTASAGRKYSAAADQLSSNATQSLGVVKGLAGTDWIGAGSSSAVGFTVVLSGALTRIGDAAASAGAALTHYSSALSHAQSQWDHARTLANQAVTDEATYRTNAETQATTMEHQAAASGNIGLAHAANSVRADAASYTSPLRGRAIALATGARQEATTAGNTAASAVGNAASAVVTPPPAPGTSSGVGGGQAEHDSLLKWLNDYVLGGANTGAAALTLPPAVVAGGQYARELQAAQKLPAQLRAMWDATVGPLALQADRDGNWAPVIAKANKMLGVSSMFRADSASRLDAAQTSLARGGIPKGAFFDGASKALGGLAIVGDVGTLISPGGDSTAENDTNRGAAALNGLGTVAALQMGDEIPVAGEVIIVGSGVYLGGDWLYHHWTPFHNAVDATGHFVTHDVPHFVTHDVPNVVTHDVPNFVTHTVPDTAKTVVHDIEPWHW